MFILVKQQWLSSHEIQRQGGLLITMFSLFILSYKLCIVLSLCPTNPADITCHALCPTGFSRQNQWVAVTSSRGSSDPGSVGSLHNSPSVVHGPQEALTVNIKNFFLMLCQLPLFKEKDF